MKDQDNCDRAWRASTAMAMAAAWCLMAASPSFAFTVSLTSPQTSPQPVSTVIGLQAAVTGIDPAQVLYRFDARTISGQWKLLRDWSTHASFDWASLKEDVHLLRVTAEDTATSAREFAVIPIVLASPGVVVGPVAIPTAHPLVALYSGPSCPVGAFMRVRFWEQAAGGPGQTTPFKACDGTRGVNHYVAGMRQSTAHVMRQEIFANGTLTPGPGVPFVTGALAGFTTDFNILDPADPTTSVVDRFFLTTYLTPNPDGRQHVATDLSGNVVWTYELPAGTTGGDLTRPVNGGTFMTILGEDGQPSQQVLREIDLAGNTVRETSVGAVNRQLATLGADPIGSFHHDARRLAGGKTVVISSVERILIDVQGPGPVNVVGDAILVLDSNFQVQWYWNSFSHLDTTRMALNGNTCTNGQPGCPPIFLGEPANDWTHSNAVAYSPNDGNLILSARHQDWVFKIDYANGTGTGAVLWTLGKDGDFLWNSADPWPWFSHQHDAQYQGPYLMIYDNGNMRRAGAAIPEDENSRGQVLLLDEVNKFVSVVANIDLGIYAQAVGSSQRLSNGNYFFHSGLTAPLVNFESAEFTPAGTKSWAISDETWSYRAFRLRSMYNQ